MSSTDGSDGPHPLSGAFATSDGVGLDAGGGVFEVLNVAPAGGMGLVVHARDRVLDREVAIKRARPDVPGSHDRLRREARVLGQLDHPAVVRVFAAGPDPDSPEAGFRVVLDWIGGGALTDVFGTPKGTIALEAVAQALAHAHARGFVHRDLKPSNVRLAPPERSGVSDAVLIDWGLARQVGESASADSFDTLERRLTQTGTTVGTPGYMAPEQVLHAAASPASDVWAFGVLLWQHLTASPPPDAGEVLSETRWAERERNLRAEHGRLGALAADCLQRDPALRPRDGSVLHARYRRATATLPGDTSGRRGASLGIVLLACVATAVASGLLVRALSDTDAPGPSTARQDDQAAEAFAQLAWQALRAGRDEDARRWAQVLADRSDSPAVRGLAWLPEPPPVGDTFAVDCAAASLSPDGRSLVCAGETLRLLDARTGVEQWSDRLDVEESFAVDGGAVLRSGDTVLRADRDGAMKTIARSRPNITVDVVGERVLARTGAKVGTRTEVVDVVLWRDHFVRTPAVWDAVREGWLAGRARDVVLLDPTSLDIVHTTPAFATEDLTRVHASADPDGPVLALGIRGELTVLSRDGEVLHQRQLGRPTLLTGAALTDSHVAIASEDVGIQVFEVATGGLLAQMATHPPDALALDGDALVWVEDGVLRRRPLPVRPRAWHVTSLSAGALVDGWLAMAGEGRVVELATPSGEPRVTAIDPAYVIKGITRLGNRWAVAHTDTYVKWASREETASIGTRRNHRDLVRLANGSVLAIPYAGGPELLHIDGTSDRRLERPEEFVTATPDRAGERVGLVSKDGDVFGVRLGADGVDIDQVVHHDRARFALPVDGGWLVLDDEGAWAYGPQGNALEASGTPGETGSNRRWASQEPVTAVAVGGSRCVLGHRSGRVVVRDCGSGRQLAVLDAHTERIAELLLDPTETTLLTAAWDDQVHRFALPEPR